MDRKLKHLDFIQGVINRLSMNSFLLKGWSVLLVSALIGLSVNDSSLAFVLLAYVPACMFWGLDGYFLWQERVYRELYDRVRTKDPGEIDFSMDTRSVLKDVKGWADATVSKTLVPFHGVLLATIIVVMIIQIVTGE